MPVYDPLPFDAFAESAAAACSAGGVLIVDVNGRWRGRSSSLAFCGNGDYLGIPKGVLSAGGDMPLALSIPSLRDEVMRGRLIAYDAPGSMIDRDLLTVYADHLAVGLESTQRPNREDPLTERVANLEAVERLVISSAKIEQFCRGLQTHVAPLFDASMVGVLIYNDEDDVLQLLEGSFGTDAVQAASYRLDVNNHTSNAVRILHTGVPYLTNDARHDRGILGRFGADFGITNIMSVPIRRAGRVVGVCSVANKASGFEIGELSRLLSVAERVGTLLDYSWTMSQARRQAEIEGAILDSAESIASGAKIVETITVAARRIHSALSLHSLTIVSDHVDIPVVLGARPSLDLDTELPERATQAERICMSVSEDTTRPARVEVLVPVLLAGKRIGTIAAIRLGAQKFAWDERNALEAFADAFSLAYATEDSHRQRSELTRREERTRLSAELHGDVRQLLKNACEGVTSLRATLGRQPDIDRAAELLERAQAELDRLTQWDETASVRFDEALDGLVARLARDFDLDVQITQTKMGRRAGAEARREHADVLLRVTREALVNVAKHAHTDRATVRVDVDDEHRIVLSVSDAGTGFISPASRSRYGLASLRRAIESRGGDFHIDADPVRGSAVTARLVP